MSRSISWATVSLCVLIVGWFCTTRASSAPAPGAAAPAAPANKAPAPPAAKPPAAPAPAAKQGYIGNAGCAFCHKPQAEAWAKTKHSHPFSGLPVTYRSRAECLACHVTAFGVVTGYVNGTPKDTLEELAMVGCETCHGPGNLHKEAALRFAEAVGNEKDLEKDMRATVRKTPPESVCAACHMTQGHKQHPWYEGKPLSQMVVGTVTLGDSCGPCECQCYAPAGSNIKACAACHYRQYQSWLSGSHSILAANKLPAKYAADVKCLKCHSVGYGATSGFVAAPNVGNIGNSLGVGCESCHGPAREHVAFNRQFIGWPPLGSDLEQTAKQLIRKGQKFNACTECHVGQTHKEHPKFDKP